MTVYLYADEYFVLDMFTHLQLLELNNQHDYTIEDGEFDDEKPCQVFKLDYVDIDILDITVFVENSDFIGFMLIDA